VRAAQALRNALDTLPSTAAPGIRLALLRQLAHLYFDNGEWASAEPQFTRAIEVESGLLKTAVHGAGRRVRLPSDLHPRHAYCLLQLGRFEEALVRLETGKARLLALAVALTAARLGALHPDLREKLVRRSREIRLLTSQREDEKDKRFGTKLDDAAFGDALAGARLELKLLLDGVDDPGLSFDAIMALAPEQGALVAPVFTSKGSAVFVIPHGAKRVTVGDVLLLKDFTTVDLGVLIERSKERSEQAIDDVTKVLWDGLVAKVHARLRRLAVRRILLLPQGGLGLLPVHAAWREEDGQRRFFADDVEITYAPSALALDTSRRRATAGRAAQTSLIAGVSKSAKFGDLDSVEPEVQAVAALLGTEPLADCEATPATVLSRSRDVDYLHLACHGAFGWGTDPLESALYLSGDEPLSLADVIGRLDLSGNQLVTLSACESGVVEGSQSPDEFIGLMAGFMQAGAAGVLSSLWRVDDVSTWLLMERFYKNHVEESMQPAAALRDAQHWLRGLTREEVGRIPGCWEILLLGRRNDCPYGNPYHWAAFTYNGV
jgi:CHAT domain-containing protein